MKAAKTPNLLKRIMAALSSKTNELRTRFTIFLLLRNSRTLMDTISQKLQAVAGGNHLQHRHKKNDDDNDEVAERECLINSCHKNSAEDGCFHASIAQEAATVEGAVAAKVPCYERVRGRVDVDEKSADLPHTLTKQLEEEELTEEEDDFSARYDFRTEIATIPEKGGGNGSDGNRSDDFISEEDIDQAADLFIKRFREQICLQKQLSFTD
ncbi:hypothetical protein Nepgr_027490 [Nepenthes gracilis]|uniref:Uncharacterized protein n=1 Tax=Nepenthes gracilis TaxID=150966 RepID=A0AAD3Y1A0_NEPGR|nr:hypothetical protein Nepgr_027490 [Nepenthes gracilis]